LKIAFIIGWPRAQKEANATLWLYAAAWNRGHDAWLVDYLNLGLDPAGQVVGRCLKPALQGPTVTRVAVARALQTGAFREERRAISRFDAAFLRANPHDRFSNWNDRGGVLPLLFGRVLARSGVLVINNPARMEEAATVMYLQDLDRAWLPRTLVTRDEGEVREFVKGLGGPAILKPLHGSGGDGIFLLGGEGERNLSSMVDSLGKGGYIVAQEFIPEAVHGDKRVLLWCGRPLALGGGAVSAYRRIHRREDFRNNIHAGGTRERTHLTEGEGALLAALGDKLRRDGILLAGVDVAGEKLIEVNVFAPGGVGNISALYGIDLADLLLADLEARLGELQGHAAG
jgi:glutathione synthase